jgi:flagellar L-ring protein precursor FlgH
VTRGALALALVALTAGCARPTLSTHVARQRDYAAGSYAQRDPGSQPGNGSLFSDAIAGYLEDTRAVRVGDLVVVRIDEHADARGGATTDLRRESSANLGIANVLGLIPALRTAVPELDPTRLLEVASRSNFTGNGNTARNGELSGSIAVRVTREMPNGDLFVEGTKLVRINSEQYHLYVSGLVRRADIAQDNSVPSSRIADAQVEFSGEGDVADTNRRGWLLRLLDVINPF